MKIRYLGQGGFAFRFGDKDFIVDPFITGNPMAGGIDVHALVADYILITHGHGDHISDVESIAERTGAKIISNYEIVTFYEGKGIKGHPMNHGGKFTFDFGTIKYVNAIHTSSFPDGTYAGAPGGFVLWNDTGCFYIAGDTALTMDMKLIPMTCPKLDFAILPIGDNFTMGSDDAAIAAEFIECDQIIGCHYDTFGYIEIDHNQAIKAFEDKGKNLILREVGDKIEI